MSVFWCVIFFFLWYILIAFDFQTILELVAQFIHACEWLLNCILDSDPDQHPDRGVMALYKPTRSFVLHRMETGVLQVLERILHGTL